MHGYLSPQELNRLAGQLADVQLRIANLTRSADLIKAEIRLGVPGPDTYQAGSLKLSVSPNYRLNPIAALKLMPADVKAVCVKLVEHVDGEKLKVLAPETYWASVTTYAHRVSVS